MRHLTQDQKPWKKTRPPTSRKDGNLAPAALREVSDIEELHTPSHKR
jgi:hypothetical protein